MKKQLLLFVLVIVTAHACLDAGLYLNPATGTCNTCDKGYYCPSGSTSRVPCPVGNYQNMQVPLFHVVFAVHIWLKSFLVYGLGFMQLKSVCTGPVFLSSLPGYVLPEPNWTGTSPPSASVDGFVDGIDFLVRGWGKEWCQPCNTSTSLGRTSLVPGSSRCPACIAEDYYLDQPTDTCKPKGAECNPATHYEVPSNTTRVCLPLRACDMSKKQGTYRLAVGLPAIEVLNAYILKYQTRFFPFHLFHMWWGAA